MDGNAGSEITIVGHQNREIVRDADQKPLMPGTLCVIGQKAHHEATSLDLDVGRVRSRRGA
jgi:hypothetical protein